MAKGKSRAQDRRLVRRREKNDDHPRGKMSGKEFKRGYGSAAGVGKKHTREIEEEDMTNKVSDLIQHTVNEKPVDFQHTFDELMQPFVQDAIDQSKYEIAQSMLQPEPTEISEEEVVEYIDWLFSLEEEQFNEEWDQLTEEEQEFISGLVSDEEEGEEIEEEDTSQAPAGGFKKKKAKVVGPEPKDGPPGKSSSRG